MFLDTNLEHVTVLLLGADQHSRSARRLRAAGAIVVDDVNHPTPPGLILIVGEPAPWKTLAAQVIERHGHIPVAVTPAERTGVTLIGGGPGPDDLVTTRGLDALADADVVLLDRLAPQEIVSTQAPHAQIIHVGKWPGHHPVPQEEIHRIMLESAAQGRHVVRFHGGDPYVFGRGGEQVADCESWGVPVDVVPGVSSAVAVPAIAGIPVTFRDVARTFTVTSGHVPFSDEELRGFCTLLATGATVVVLMGVATLPQLTGGLMRHGAATDTPVAVVEKGFSPEQIIHTTTLESAVSDAARVNSPAVTVVGPVAALASEDREHILGDLTTHRAVAHPQRTRHHGPLHGRTVAVTAHRRAADQIQALERKGAKTIAAPALKLVPVDQDHTVMAETHNMVAAAPDLMVITTGYGLTRWWEVAEASESADDLHAMLAAADIWVRGPKGRAAVRKLGLHDVGVSSDETIATLIDEILTAHHDDLTGMVIGWQENGYHDRYQRQRLANAGASVHQVVPHRWADADDSGMVPHMIRAVCDRQINAVTFTSAAGSEAVLSTAADMGLAEEFVAAFTPPSTSDPHSGKAWDRVVAATVGPITASPLQDAGIPALVPTRFRMGAMIQQLVDVLHE